MTWLELLRWFILPGCVFLTIVWAVIVVVRMKRDQAVATAIQDAKVARMGLKTLVDQLQSDALGDRQREQAIEVVVRRVDRLLCVWARHWGEPAPDVKAELLRAINGEREN